MPAEIENLCALDRLEVAVFVEDGVGRRSRGLRKQRRRDASAADEPPVIERPARRIRLLRQADEAWADRRRVRAQRLQLVPAELDEGSAEQKSRGRLSQRELRVTASRRRAPRPGVESAMSPAVSARWPTWFVAGGDLHRC